MQRQRFSPREWRRQTQELLLQTFHEKLEEIARTTLSDQRRLLSEKLEIAPKWAEKIADKRMMAQWSLLAVQLKATEPFFFDRVMSAVDIMLHLSSDDRSQLVELCRRETDRLPAKQRANLRLEWHEVVFQLRRRKAVEHLRNCSDDEIAAVLTCDAFRTEFHSAASDKWRMVQRRIWWTYWTTRIHSLLGKR